jgi:small subunit ribosomal protein S2
VALLDTNSDPDVVDYGIPANDDAIRSVSLMCEIMADAILAGTGAGEITAAEMLAEKPAEAEAPKAEETPAE